MSPWLISCAGKRGNRRVSLPGMQEEICNSWDALCDIVGGISAIGNLRTSGASLLRIPALAAPGYLEWCVNSYDGVELTVVSKT